MPLPYPTLGSRAALILTAAMELPAQAYFDTLRTQHFPPERNLVPAHLTLFHALPGAEYAGICETLHRLSNQAPMTLQVTGLRNLGHGVAFTVAGDPLHILHRTLQQLWSPWLTAQDRQGFRPHIVIQNKVNPAAAKSLHAALSTAFIAFSVVATGLTLWRYLGGPWEWAASFEFPPVNSHSR